MDEIPVLIKLTPAQADLLRFLAGHGPPTLLRLTSYEALIRAGLIERHDEAAPYLITQFGLRVAAELLRRQATTGQFENGT